MTNQPVWKELVNLGDVNPLEYGGYFVYEDQTGTYAPEAEYLCDNGNGSWSVYRFPLDRCTFLNGVLSDNPYHPKHSAWFGLRKADRPQDSGLEDVARFTGQSVEDLIGALCSEDPQLRADAYRSIGEYFGFDNLDSYPLTLAEKDLPARYPEYA